MGEGDETQDLELPDDGSDSELDDLLLEDEFALEVNEAVGPSRHLSPDQVIARAQMAPYLESSEFPATRQDLVENVESQNAPEAVVELVKKLPDERFDYYEAAWLAVDRVA